MQTIQSHHKPLMRNADYDVWRWASAVTAGAPPAISTATDNNTVPKDSLARELVTIFSVVKWARHSGSTYTVLTFERGEQAHVQFNMKLRILPLLLSLALMVGCASEFQSTGSASSATDDSADRSFHDTIDRVNQQAALDAANAAAQEQNNAATAAAQETENQHNAESFQNGPH